MSRAKAFLIGAAVMAALAAPAAAFIPPELSEDGWVPDCKSYAALPPDARPTTVQQGQCIGVIEALVQTGRSSHTVCAPSDTSVARPLPPFADTRGTAIKVQRWLEANPKMSGETDISRIFSALRGLYPCTSGR
jgi:hypothetical protein